MRQPGRSYVNIHGRKRGRGLRPLLLIPKVISLAVFVGSFTSATVLWFYFRSGQADEPRWALQAVSLLFRTLIVPSLAATLLFGALLFLQHPAVFVRRRWLQVKWIIAALLFVVHFLARGTFETVKLGFLGDTSPGPANLEPACQRFSMLMIIALAGAVLLVFLGRHKPRLGQFPEPLPGRSSNDAADGERNEVDDTGADEANPNKTEPRPAPTSEVKP